MAASLSASLHVDESEGSMADAACPNMGVESDDRAQEGCEDGTYKGSDGQRYHGERKPRTDA
eukprot:428185-Rhodomonas_salina.1